MTVHAYWLAFTLPVLAVSLWLLVRVAIGLMRATRASIVANAPMREVKHLPSAVARNGYVVRDGNPSHQ